jgi:mannose-6-phosphate isomerase-like protein (cupin superfamily)
MVKEPYVVHINDVEPVAVLGPDVSLKSLIGKGLTEGKLGLGVCIVKPGGKSSKWKQSHPEVHYITSGELEFHFGDKKIDVKAGNAVYVPESDVDCYWVNSGKKETTVVYASTYH